MSKLLDYIFAEDIRREIDESKSRVMTYANDEVFRNYFQKRFELSGLMSSSTIPNITSLLGLGSIPYFIHNEDYIGGTLALFAIVLLEWNRKVSRKSIIHKLEEAESEICYNHYNSDQDYDKL